MLNKNLFQILISDENQEAGFPHIVRLNIESLKDVHPNYAYHRLNGTDIEALINANFDRDILHAFRGLQPHAYKADLGRYCLLLVHGGIYVDIAMRMLRPIELPPHKKMICFRDSPGTGLWTVSNGLIASAACRREFKLAIDMIVANFRAKHYGATSLHPTGPALFGRALAMADCEEDVEIGTFGILGDQRNPNNLGYCDGTGRLVAVRMKSGRFADFGLKGTNDYASLWADKRVYGETACRYNLERLYVPPAHLHHSAAAIQTSSCIKFTRPREGVIVCGPSVPFKKGRYVGSYIFAPNSRLAGLTFDVFYARSGHENTILTAGHVEADEKMRFSIEFSLEHDVEALQIRVYTNGKAEGEIVGLEVDPAP